MKRVRLATWAAVAGLGLLAGCQSADPCGGRPGLMARLGCRRGTPGCEGMPVSGGPVVSGLPITPAPDCCDGAFMPHYAPGFPADHGVAPPPILNGDPPVGHDAGPGPILLPPNGGLPPGAIPVQPNGLPPGAFPAPGAGAFPAPAQGGTPPAGVLPPPAPVDGAAPPLAPVPNGGFAPPTPAAPSSRRKTR